MKLPQSIDLGKFRFISADLWTGNLVKDCKQKVRQSIEDGTEAGPMEVSEALRVERASKGRKVDEKAQNSELVAEKTKMGSYVGT